MKEIVSALGLYLLIGAVVTTYHYLQDSEGLEELSEQYPPFNPQFVFWLAIVGGICIWPLTLIDTFKSDDQDDE